VDVLYVETQYFLKISNLLTNWHVLAVVGHLSLPSGFFYGSKQSGWVKTLYLLNSRQLFWSILSIQASLV